MPKTKPTAARRVTEAQVRSAERKVKREHRQVLKTWCRENVHRFRTAAEMIAEAETVFAAKIPAADWQKFFDFLVKLITLLMGFLAV